MDWTYAVSIDDQPPHPLKVSALTAKLKRGALCEVEVDGTPQLCLIVDIGIGLTVRRLPNLKSTTGVPA